MALERLQIANLERWGNLVKTWATGVNKLGDGNVYPLPKSLLEFTQQLDLALVGHSIPAHVQSVMFVQAQKETLLFRLPPKELVEDSESTLNLPGTVYPIPRFYNRLFGNQTPTIPDADRLKVHAERIGDYTMANCV